MKYIYMNIIRQIFWLHGTVIVVGERIGLWVTYTFGSDTRMFNMIPDNSITMTS